MVHIARDLIFIFAVPFALLGLHLRSGMTRSQRTIWIGGLLVVIALAAAQLLTIARANIRIVPEWDFLGFWLAGHVAAAHHNVYDPTYARDLVRPFAISSEFRREIIDTGFWYPPPSIVLFLPLAMFKSVHAAYAAWYVVQFAALAGAIFVLARTFVRDYGVDGLLAVAAITLVIPATASTVTYGQTNFLLLLLIALFWQARTRISGGVWFGLAMLVKPFVAIAGLALLIRRALAPIGGAIAAIVVATILAVVLFGPRVIGAYLHAGPNAKLPQWVYSEPTNTSLLGAILRVTHATPTGSGIPLPATFVICALVLLLATIWLCARAEDGVDETVLALCLVLGLLIYPVSQMFYAILLVVPVLVLWARRMSLPWQANGVAAFATLLYLLMRAGSEGTVIAYTLLWIVLAAACLQPSGIARPAFSRRGPRVSASRANR